MLATESETLVALATTDGKTVHEHFGHASVFHIIAINKDTYRYLESRNVPPACNDHEHTNAAFEAVWEILSDCKAVAVGKIGPPAAAFLIGKGLQVFETVGFVNEIIEEIIAQNLLKEVTEK
jgi:predicted Fe-Mo cluster-binding NifX family protein